jgi:hypothetical protein
MVAWERGVGAVRARMGEGAARPRARGRAGPRARLGR